MLPLQYEYKDTKMKKIDIIASATALAKAQVAHYRNASETNKAHFTKFYNLVKEKRSRETAVLALTEASKVIDLEASKREFKSSVTMAVVYCDINTVVNFGKVNWDNLKQVIRLHSKVVKYYKTEDVKELAKNLGEIWEKGMSDFRYNNSLELAIKTLKEQYPTPEKVEEHTDIIERIMVDTDKLTVSELKDIVAKIQENIKSKGEEITEPKEKEGEQLAA